MVAQNNTDFMLAPGETNVYGDSFIDSLMAPYLKAQMMCSSTRFVFKDPNTFLGAIPVGTNENTIPLRAIASVSTSTTFRFGRALLGLVCLLAGFNLLGSGAMSGLLLVLFGVMFALTCLPAVLVVQNHAGGATAIEVAIIERQKLQRFCQELQSRVFTDQNAIHHQEAQTLRAQQVTLQQLSLQQQMNMQQQANVQQQLQQAQFQQEQGQQGQPPVDGTSAS